MVVKNEKNWKKWVDNALIALQRAARFIPWKWATITVTILVIIWETVRHLF